MRSIRVAEAALAGLVVAMAAAPAAAFPLDCASLNGRTTTTVQNSGFDLVVSFNLKPGDVITIKNTATFLGGTTATMTLPLSLTVAPGASASGTIAAAVTSVVVGTSSSVIIGSTTRLDFTCVSAAAAAGSTSTPINQNINNAQVGIQNGQQSLESFNDWLSKTVVRSFDSRRPAKTAAGRLGALTAEARLRQLQGEERDLTEELAELHAQDRPSDGGTADLERRLAAVRRNLMFARSSAQLSRARSTPVQQASASQEYSLVPDGVVGLSRPVPPAPAVSLDARQLAEFCAPGDGLGVTDDPLGRKWNVWLEARAVGAVDSVAQNNVFGFNGSTGADYKIQPWLAVGLSVGVETYETKFGTAGVRAGTVGLSVMPYVGVRLTDNVFASAFTGLSHINYNTNPGAGITAQFDSLRFMVGGALTGVWRSEQWRLQPTLAGAFGSETQNAYVDSIGNSVAAQTLTYGRISAGPEVGYTFSDAGRNWSFEPFVTARLNVDFASSAVSVVNGTSVNLRPGTLASGSAGLGAEMRFLEGFFFCAQGSYDSIGVSGLDVWTGLLRGGMSF